jgi:putative copper export protein
MLNAATIVPLVSHILHIIGAVILVGGIVYLRTVVAPGAAPGEGDPVDRLYSGRRTAWARWVGIATGLLLATGIINIVLVMKTYPNLSGSYRAMLGAKIVLALVVMFLAAILAGTTPAALELRKAAQRWLTVALISGLAVIILASTLRLFRTPTATGTTARPEPPKQPLLLNKIGKHLPKQPALFEGTSPPIL